MTGFMVKAADELERMRAMAAAMYLIHMSHEINSEETTLTVGGMTAGKEPIGNWEVVIRRKAPEGTLAGRDEFSLPKES